MSRFLSERHKSLVTYIPGEQPQDRRYIKLNTNESPYPPSPGVLRAVAEEVPQLHLYADPECRELRERAAEHFGVRPEQILFSNGSDEILNFAFLTYGDSKHPFIFPSLTYGFYSVFAGLYHIPYETVPLREDFSVDPTAYYGRGGTIIIANPNAPTGLMLSVAEIEQIVAANPQSVVIIDEAYVDFGGESCVRLIDTYDNLLVTRTFSKSYALAGARLGVGIGSEALIADLTAVKYATNPYNVNRMTQAAGLAAIADAAYYRRNCAEIVTVRERTQTAMRDMGFTLTDSQANFLFAAHPRIGGRTLYERLRAAGILVRHFPDAGIDNYIRITVGTPEQMDILLDTVKTILADISDGYIKEGGL